MTTFLSRVSALPRLGIGVSTEYGASGAPGALDPAALRAAHPDFAAFLEVGVEVSKGLDVDASAWGARGWPTTYHFLDVNLDDPADLDADWLGAVRALVGALRPAWLCGDAGLWHFGARDRGQMLLLPPILVDAQIGPMADGVRALREATGLEVLPENPPGAAFVGDLHLLEFFARLADQADTGVLLDCAHLAMYELATGRDVLAALADFPLERVVEIHVAGGAVQQTDGLAWIEDDHGPRVLDRTWQITEAVLRGATNLKAVIVECERNPIDAVLPVFHAVAARLAALRPGERWSGAPCAE
jgi:uncharacterized protein (UPF0276 family)